MTENNEKANFENSSSRKVSPLISAEPSPAKTIKNSAEKQSGQEEFNKEVLEKLESIQNQLKNLGNQKDLIEKLIGKSETDVSFSQEQLKEIEPPSIKQFVLSHIFENVSETTLKKQPTSEVEEHFGGEWYISIGWKNDNLACQLFLVGPEDVSFFSFQTKFEIRVIQPEGRGFSKILKHFYEETGGSGLKEIIEWKELWMNDLAGDSLKVEAHVTNECSYGLCEHLRSYDESAEECSDVVLYVDYFVFHVSKLYLATHSSYFKAMFLGKFSDSKQSEIILNGVDPDDFQKYLEVLYGEYAITEPNVEGVLLLGDMYDTELVIRRCEEFLLENSKKTLKKKLEMSVRYKLNDLKKQCLAEIKTVDDIRSVVSSDLHDMEPSIMAKLLGKALASK